MGRKKILREIRTCDSRCGCGKTFECKINSKKRFAVVGHCNKKSVMVSKLKSRTWEQIYGEKAKEIHQKHSIACKDINKKPTKKIYCLNCGKCDEVIYTSNRKYCSRNCAQKVAYKNAQLWRKGKKYNEMYGEERAKSIKSNQSESHAKAMIALKFIPGNGRRGYKRGYFYSKKNSKNLYYMSSWELTAFQILESLVSVKNYRAQYPRIKYFYNGEERWYVVDISVEYEDGQKQLIEVKRKYEVLNDNRVKCKLDAGRSFARQNNMKFDVWTEDKLFTEAVNV